MVSAPSPRTIRFLPRRRLHPSSDLLAALICAFALLCFLATSTAVWHWFVFPVYFCGVLVTRDAVDWLRGRLPVFDPVGLFGCFGVHFFFLAYLLHPYVDFYWHYPFPPNDWRPWLGYSATLNLVGLILYRLILRRSPKWTPRTQWILHRPRFLAATVVTLTASFMMQIYFYRQFGGILGAIYAREDPSRAGDPFRGLGWAMTIAESFPIIAVMAALVLTRKSRFWSSRLSLPALLLGSLLLCFFFGGLRGSRSTIFLVLFWTVVLFHFLVRPLRRVYLLVAPLILFFFMFGYIYYKHGGVEGALHFGDPEIIDEIEDHIGFGNTDDFIVLHDFARADAQALVLYLVTTDNEYRYALGRTYLSALTSIVPRVIWPSRPEDSNREKVELLYGSGPGPDRVVSWVFGLAGEAIFNFGPVAAPLTFVLFATAVLAASRTARLFQGDDARVLLWPLLLYACFALPLAEARLILFLFVKSGLIPLLVVYAGSRRVVRSQPGRFGAPA